MIDKDGRVLRDLRLVEVALDPRYTPPDAWLTPPDVPADGDT